MLMSSDILDKYPDIHMQIHHISDILILLDMTLATMYVKAYSHSG